MSKKLTALIIASAAAVAGSLVFFGVNCHSMKMDGNSFSVIGGADGPTSIFIAGKTDGGGENMGYVSITMEEAKELFKLDGSYMILDVRRPEEFAQGHIPGAINIPNEDIETMDVGELLDKDQIIYVYCRSGVRSKQAAEKLVNLGYGSIIEIGGIMDWTGELE